MISKYINDWIKIIENMSTDNTYKLAWGRAIVECVNEEKFFYENNNFYISFDDIAKKMLKYYWNQMFFFNLKQSPYKDKEPVICKDTQKLINLYKEISKKNIAVWFETAEKILENKNKNEYEKILKHISSTLHENVSWRFLNVNGGKVPVYGIDKKNSYVIIGYRETKELKDYSIIISKLLNYKWAQLLENFNFAPKIASKVKGISNAKIKRNSLVKYKNELLKEFPDGNVKDFYTGKILKPSEISIDHVIPWSFMYSDDIWNLVITSKSHNSSKSNSIPDQKEIDRLKDRNNKLETILSGSFKLSLEEAKVNGYVDKCYFNLKI